jgi:hypothetical protein
MKNSTQDRLPPPPRNGVTKRTEKLKEINKEKIRLQGLVNNEDVNRKKNL